MTSKAQDLPHTGATDPPSAADLRATLVGILGAEHVRDDEELRALHSQDIWATAPAVVALVASPQSVEQISQTMAAASAAGFAVAPRGAGMSYTGGYLPLVERTLSLDVSRMDRVLAVNAEDMTVTVQAGCTWAALLEVLTPLGLRTPFWGPMSGLMSTIGGGLSQLNAMLGAGHYGTSSESVVGMTLVLSDGSVLRTGAREPGGNAPFYRHYGPDLAGLFCGDCGAFAVKAEITLRLIRNPPHEGYASFAFKSGAALLDAMAEMARTGVASETCAFDPGLTKVRMQRESLRSDVKKLAAVVGQQKSLLEGLAAAGRMVRAGRGFVGADDFPLHVIAEGRCAEAVTADLVTARRIALEHGGQEIENTIAKVIRAEPFPPLNSVLGPAGQRWAPIHGIAPLSKAAAVFEAVESVFADMRKDFEHEGISVGYLFTSLSTNALIVEPVFYWPDARGPVHEVAMEPEHMARLPPPLVANPKALAVVVAARERIVAVYQRFGCAHFQIGRTYPYRASRDGASWRLLEVLKRELDAAGALNPGVLGFDASVRLKASLGRIGATYRALQLTRHAPRLRDAVELAELPWRDPAPGEVAVRNTWCGVNAIFDTQIARNAVDYVQVALPSVMGVEALGRVEAVGAGVDRLAPGDAVATVRFGGGYREANVAPAPHFIKLPAPTREALALASTGVSAWLALDHVGQARAGETVAISAAAGGLGHLLVQMAKQRGCTVVAICGGADKAAFVRGLGADRVIDHRAESVADVLARDWRDAIDVAIDTISGAIHDALLDQLAPHGRLVAAGAAQDMDGRPEIVTAPRVVHKLYFKGASVRGFMNGRLTHLWPEARERVFAEHAAGRLQPHFDAVRHVGLERVVDAAEHLLSGRSMGKVVVELAPR